MILVATDGSPAAEAAERAAIELAAPGRESLVLVTVWQELRGDFGLPVSVVMPELIEVERERASGILTAAAARAAESGLEAETISRRGDPVEEICAIAAERGVRMVVAGSHGWSTVEGALFGSVLSGLLHRAPCPVLVVREPRRQPVARTA